MVEVVVLPFICRGLFSSKEKKTSGFDLKKFWEHSIACGAVSSCLAEKLGTIPGEAFVAGILHDIGKVILLQYFPDDFSRVTKKVEAGEILIKDAENEEIGINHTHVGRYLVEKWKLPVNFSDVVAFHHRPSSCKRSRDLIFVVHLSDIICRGLAIGWGGDGFVPEIDDTALKDLNFDLKIIEDYLPEIESQAEAAISILG